MLAMWLALPATRLVCAASCVPVALKTVTTVNCHDAAETTDSDAPFALRASGSCRDQVTAPVTLTTVSRPSDSAPSFPVIALITAQGAVDRVDFGPNHSDSSSPPPLSRPLPLRL